MLYVADKPVGQMHWVPVRVDEPSHSKGASRAFYGTIFKDVSGCRTASVITHLRHCIYFIFFLLQVNVLELLSWREKKYLLPPGR